MEIHAFLPNRIDAQITLQPASRFIGVTGPSGAGKSSLFRALAGVEKRAKVAKSWSFEKIGIVFQQPMLFPHTNVRGNLALAQRHASPNALSVEACVKGCYCEHLLEKPIDSLSGGEAQRVAIARALVNGPSVLLLDESLSAIDIFTRRKIYQFLNTLCVSGQLTCFVISHDLDDLALFSDELVYVEQGKVSLCGATTDVLSQVFEKEGVAIPSAVLEGQKCSESVTQVENMHGVARIMVAGHEVFVTEEAISYMENTKSAYRAHSITEVSNPEQDNGPAPVRFAVKACDVSVDINVGGFNSASTVSILNALPCTITSIEPVRLTSSQNKKSHQQVTWGGKVLLKLILENDSQALYASISHISLSRLNLNVGDKVIARFKLP